MQEANRFKEIFDKSPIGILFYNKEGKLVDANLSALELAGIPSVDICKKVNLFNSPEIKERKNELQEKGLINLQISVDFDRIKELCFYTPTKSGTTFIDLTISSIDSGFLVQIQDITRIKEAEDALKESEKNLSIELEAAQNIRQISLKLIQAKDVDALYNEILDTLITTLHADFASIQRFYPKRGELKLLGNRGFDEQSAKFWEWVRPTSKCTCGIALSTRLRAAIPDIKTSDLMAGSKDKEMYQKAGINAVQTTPLISRSGTLLGMFSTHWLEPHELTESEIRSLDILARQAADLLENKWAEEQIKDLLEETQQLNKELKVSNKELKSANEILIQKEEELMRVNRAYKALSNNSKAIINARDELDYLDSVCKIIVEDCNYPMVWIGYAEEDENKTVKPVAYSGFEEGYLKTLNISWEDNERGQGPTGAAIRTGKISMCKNMLIDPNFEPWRDEAIKRGYASSIVFPLKDKNKIFGALCIYSEEPDPFSNEEMHLMTELTNDIAYGLNSIRVHNAKIEAEKALRDAHDSLELKVQERTKELKELNEELTRSNEELQSFAYITSHDLQEPLRTMASYAQLLKRRYEGQLDHDADEFIEYMVSGATRMKSMIQGLLDYSRVDTRGEEFKQFNCKSAINYALNNLNAAIEECSAKISYDSLPPITADEIQITRVFQNLIGNAIKFRKNGIPLEINISADNRNNEYIFSISDNGIGIESQYTDRIFEVFKRLHPIGEFEGAGIGLAIVKRIIDRHGGHVWVEAELGKGSTFYFTIPVKDEFESWDYSP
ncbi:GAF domain-containing protein [Methanobacterium sp. ACI-7]|uniref:GAF domain-containing protein n=1 Tax=unclassified Methanobacterium TaxID=2627676 RepID=UPI0039C431A7